MWKIVSWSVCAVTNRYKDPNVMDQSDHVRFRVTTDQDDDERVEENKKEENKKNTDPSDLGTCTTPGDPRLDKVSLKFSGGHFRGC